MASKNKSESDCDVDAEQLRDPGPSGNSTEIECNSAANNPLKRQLAPAPSLTFEIHEPYAEQLIDPGTSGNSSETEYNSATNNPLKRQLAPAPSLTFDIYEPYAERLWDPVLYSSVSKYYRWNNMLTERECEIFDCMKGKYWGPPKNSKKVLRERMYRCCAFRGE